MLKPLLFFASLSFSSLPGAGVQVLDDLGLPVTLARAAQRIITLSPHTA